MPATLLRAPQQGTTRGTGLASRCRLRIDPVDQCAQGLAQRAGGRPFQDGAPPEQAGISRCRVVGQEHNVLQPAETRQRLSQSMLGGRTSGRGTHPVDDDLDPTGGAHGGPHLVEKLEQTTHPDGVRPADDQDHIGMRYQVGGHGPAPGLQGEVVDIIIDWPAGHVDDGPGRGPTALQPDLGHRGRWQLAPAPGSPQAAQQGEPATHRRQDPLKALGVKPAVGGQTGRPGQSRGVLRHAEELHEAGRLDVGVHEDRTAGSGQTVGEGGGDR